MLVARPRMSAIWPGFCVATTTTGRDPKLNARSRSTSPQPSHGSGKGPNCKNPSAEPGASASKYTRPATSSGYRAVNVEISNPPERASDKKVGPGHVRVGQDRVQLARERLRRRRDAGWSVVARAAESPWAVVAAEAGGGTQRVLGFPNSEARRGVARLIHHRRRSRADALKEEPIPADVDESTGRSRRLGKRRRFGRPLRRAKPG